MRSHVAEAALDRWGCSRCEGAFRSPGATGERGVDRTAYKTPSAFSDPVAEMPEYVPPRLDTSFKTTVCVPAGRVDVIAVSAGDVAKSLAASLVVPGAVFSINAPVWGIGVPSTSMPDL